MSNFIKTKFKYYKLHKKYTYLILKNTKSGFVPRPDDGVQALQYLDLDQGFANPSI